MKSIIPANLDLDNHIDLYPPSKYGIDIFDKDKAKYLLSLITTLPAKNKLIADSMEENEGYVPLYSNSMQSVVHDYKKYFVYFVSTGIVETDGKFICDFYQAGESKSYGYKFSEQYQTKEIIFENYSETFAKKLNRRRKGQYELLSKEYSHLIKWLWPNCGLSINFSIALEYLKTKRDAQNKDDLLKERKVGKTGQVKVKNPDNQYHYSMINVLSLHKNEINCVVDENVKRMHNELTSLKSELRNLITYKGEEMVSIDIVNSQPYLSLSLLKKHL